MLRRATKVALLVINKVQAQGAYTSRKDAKSVFPDSSARAVRGP